MICPNCGRSGLKTGLDCTAPSCTFRGDACTECGGDVTNAGQCFMCGHNCETLYCWFCGHELQDIHLAYRTRSRPLMHAVCWANWTLGLKVPANGPEYD